MRLLHVISWFYNRLARFVINNRDNDYFSHPFDIVIGPVADAILDQEIYIPYCFCTHKAIEQLKNV